MSLALKAFAFLGAANLNDLMFIADFWQLLKLGSLFVRLIKIWMSALGGKP